MILPKARDQYKSCGIGIRESIDKYLTEFGYEGVEDQIHIKFTDELCKILTGMDIQTLRKKSVSEINEHQSYILSHMGSYVKPLCDEDYSYDIMYMYRPDKDGIISYYIVLKPILLRHIKLV